MTNRWILGARPRTLPAAIVPVAVGTAAAVGEGAPLFAGRAAAALVVALSLQVATNFVNDYADGDRGTDAVRVGPTRLVSSGLATSAAVKKAALLAFGIAGVAGAALAVVVGPELLIVGAASMLAGWAYTGGPRPYGYFGFGEVFVFVFFGLVATAGSTYVQLERITALSLVAAVPVGGLAVALLVSNNLRDISGDAEAGKQTLAVRIGDFRTRRLYAALFLLVGVSILASALIRPLAAIALLGLVFAVKPTKTVVSGASGAALIPVLAATGMTQMATGLLLAVGIALGGI